MRWHAYLAGISLTIAAAFAARAVLPSALKSAATVTSPGVLNYAFPGDPTRDDTTSQYLLSLGKRC